MNSTTTTPGGSQTEPLNIILISAGRVSKHIVRYIIEHNRNPNNTPMQIVAVQVRAEKIKTPVMDLFTATSAPEKESIRIIKNIKDKNKASNSQSDFVESFDESKIQPLTP